MKAPSVIGWENWLGSEEGKRCASDAATGDYLHNRLWHAYMSGWGDAAARALDKIEKLQDFLHND